ncbi:MAG: hypothetical protein WBF88_16205, partial [Pusillimonas sp.]
MRKPGVARAVPASRATAQALPGLPGSVQPAGASAELARSGQWPDTRRAHTTADLHPRQAGLN